MLLFLKIKYIDVKNIDIKSKRVMDSNLKILSTAGTTSARLKYGNAPKQNVYAKNNGKYMWDIPIKIINGIRNNNALQMLFLLNVNFLFSKVIILKSFIKYKNHSMVIQAVIRNRQRFLN